MTESTLVFTEQERRISDLAKALSHPARLRILQILARQHTCICGEIVDQLPFSQSTVSQHLKELKRVGLITGAISGPRTCYCLDPHVLQGAHEAFTRLMDGLCGRAAGSPEGETFEL